MRLAILGADRDSLSIKLLLIECEQSINLVPVHPARSGFGGLLECLQYGALGLGCESWLERNSARAAHSPEVELAPESFALRARVSDVPEARDARAVALDVPLVLDCLLARMSLLEANVNRMGTAVPCTTEVQSPFGGLGASAWRTSAGEPSPRNPEPLRAALPLFRVGDLKSLSHGLQRSDARLSGLSPERAFELFYFAFQPPVVVRHIGYLQTKQIV